MTIARRFLYLFLALFCSISSATTFTRILTEITPENSNSESVFIHFVANEPDCAGIQVWVDAPAFFTKASIHIGKAESEELKLGGEVITLPPEKLISEVKYSPYEADFLKERLLRDPDKFKFLVGGFHGVYFCARPNLLTKITLEFISSSQSFLLAPLDNWIKNETVKKDQP
jgi:hypothetical protein